MGPDESRCFDNPSCPVWVEDTRANQQHSNERGSAREEGKEQCVSVSTIHGCWARVSGIEEWEPGEGADAVLEGDEVTA